VTLGSPGLRAGKSPDFLVLRGLARSGRSRTKAPGARIFSRNVANAHSGACRSRLQCWGLIGHGATRAVFASEQLGAACDAAPVSAGGHQLEPVRSAQAHGDRYWVRNHPHRHTQFPGSTPDRACSMAAYYVGWRKIAVGSITVILFGSSTPFGTDQVYEVSVGGEQGGCEENRWRARNERALWTPLISEGHGAPRLATGRPGTSLRWYDGYTSPYHHHDRVPPHGGRSQTRR